MTCRTRRDPGDAPCKFCPKNSVPASVPIAAALPSRNFLLVISPASIFAFAPSSTSCLFHALWRLRPVQCVVKRSSGLQRRIVLGYRYRKNADLVVIRESKGFHSCRNIDRISKQVRVLVRLIESVDGMMMRNIPGQGGRLNKTRLQPNIVLGVSRRRCASFSLLLIGWGPWRMGCGDCPILLRLIFPHAVIPLTDESAPILDIQFNSFVTRAE